MSTHRQPGMLLAASLLLCSTSGCAVRDYLPAGPTLSKARADSWLASHTEPVTSLGPPRVEPLIPPFQVFALHYELDLVIETRHPRWQMHEYALVETDQGPAWLAKDSDMEGVQTVTADLEELESVFPEVPVPRVQGPVDVDDRSEPGRVDVTIRYRSPAGEEMEVDFAGPVPHKDVRKRNGSTFNHSRQAVAAVLDIPRRRTTGIEARVTVDGEPVPTRRVLGIFPVRAILSQTQAGVAAASMSLETTASGDLRVRRPLPGVRWPTRSEETWEVVEPSPGQARLVNRATLSTQIWAFDQGGLSHAVVEDREGRELFRLDLGAPLPDLRRPFEGEVTRAFTMRTPGGVHGHGLVVCRDAGEDGLQVDLLPVAPRWLAERPFRTTVTFGEAGAVAIETSPMRSGPEHAPPG